MGDIDSALSYYQKAIYIDPLYAPAYNDLGVLNESKGNLDLAEQSYLRAVELDPQYLAAYYNLASLYEKKDRPVLALYYWKQRIERGLRGELWTEKARENLLNLAQKYPDVRNEIIRMEASELDQQVLQLKQSEFENRIALSRKHFAAGKKYVQEKEYRKAVEEFDSALRLTPDSQEIFLAREEAIKALATDKMNQHFEMSRKLYELGDYPAARAEVKKALTLIPEVSNR